MKHIALISGTDIAAFDYWNHVGFWKRALTETEGIETHLYTWRDWESMPNTYDLYFFLDFRAILWNVVRHDYHPRILFWWDAFHHMQSLSVQLALVFDKVYNAELIDTNYARSLGFSNVEWLPGAYYEGLYHPESRSKVHDFAFIGQFDDTVIRNGITRKGILHTLCSCYHGFISDNCRGPFTNQVYNESKILPDRTIFANIGTRLFEVVGSGGFCLINRYPTCRTGLDKHGVDGEHFVSYDDSVDDLIRKFEYYHKHEDERCTIAYNGHKHFSQNHTYAHRIYRILKDFSII